MTDNEENMITISGKEYSVIHEAVHIDKLKYYPRNPRIAIRISEEGIDEFSDDLQEKLEKLMFEESSFRNLVSDIENNSGVMEAILVNAQTYDVIEGNSRLAAMRKLHADYGDPDKWNTIPCQLVAGLDLGAIDAYLYTTHVKGKTPWIPYAKANMAYQRIEVEDLYSVEDYSSKVAFETEAEIRKQIAIIKQMHHNGDTKRNNFSYYDVLVRNGTISERIQIDLELKQKVWDEIKRNSEDFTALHLRQKLPVIIESPKNLKRYKDGTDTLHEAYERAKKGKPVEKVKEALKKLESVEKKHIDKAKISDLNAFIQGIKNCRKELDRLSNIANEAKKKIHGS